MQDRSNKKDPIDFDSIEKGSVISRYELVKILGKCEDYEFQYRLVGFSEYVRKELWNRGKHFTVRIKDFTIEILSDEEASDYNTDHFSKGLKKLRKAHRQILAVDSSEFASEQRQRHDRAIVVQAAILSGIRESRRGLGPIPAKRKTPGLVTV